MGYVKFNLLFMFFNRSRFREFMSRRNARRRIRSWGLHAVPFVVSETWSMAMPKLYTEPTTHRKAAPSDRKLGYSVEKLQTVRRLVLWRHRRRRERKTVRLVRTPRLREEYNCESFLGVMNVTPSLTLAGIFVVAIWFNYGSKIVNNMNKWLNRVRFSGTQFRGVLYVLVLNVERSSPRLKA